MVSFYTLNNIYLTTNPPGKNLNLWERKTEREGERERERDRERGYTQQMPILENAYNKNFGSWKWYKYNKTCKLVSFPWPKTYKLFCVLKLILNIYYK